MKAESNEGDGYDYYRDELVDKKLEKAFKKLVQDYFDRKGIIIEEIYAGAIGINKSKITLEGVAFSGGSREYLE